MSGRFKSNKEIIAKHQSVMTYGDIHIKRIGLPCSGVKSLGEIVTVHGMLENSNVWSSVEFLNENFDIVHLEFPWSGQQGGDWCLDVNALNIISAVFEKWSLKEPTYLIGHSFGANLLLNWANDSTSKIANLKALILVSPFYAKREDALTWRLFRVYQESVEDFILSSFKVSGLSHSVSKESITAMVNKIMDIQNPLVWMEFYKIFVKTVLQELDGLNVPVQIIVGSKEKTVNVEDMIMLSEKIQSCKLDIVDEVGHFPMKENECEFLERLKLFLTNQNEELKKAC